MIVPKGFRLSTLVMYVGTPLLALFVWDIIIVVAYQVLHWEWVGSRHIPLALYGGAIGVIVGFRNNSSYARWWEARGLWGQIVNNSRSVGRQVVSTMRSSRPEEAAALAALQRTIVYHQIAYVHALRQQLRGLPPIDTITPFIDEAELALLREQKNVALQLQRTISDLLEDALTSGWLDSFGLRAIEGNLDDLLDAQGGAERIKNTPMPKQYDYFPMLFVHIYCVMLPIGLVETLGWLTPLGSTVVGFMLLALDKIGRDLENPFENAIFDIPLTSITTTIEINLRQLLGETRLPPPVAPIDGVLW